MVSHLGGGAAEHFFSTRLTDATVVDIDCQMPHCQDANKSEFTQLIRVALAYRKIEWEHTVAGTSGADDLACAAEADALQPLGGARFSVPSLNKIKEAACVSCHRGGW